MISCIGLSFWKVGSRKVYAVLESSISSKGKGKKSPRYISSDNNSDSDFEPARKKGMALRVNSSKLNKISLDIENIKNDLESVFKLTKDTKIPISLTKILHDTFICHICRNAPMMPPIIFARCCKRIIGCQSCVDEWYTGASNSENPGNCPLCRSERAYADTTVLKGMDDFLKAINPMLNEINDANELNVPATIDQ